MSHTAEAEAAGKSGFFHDRLAANLRDFGHRLTHPRRVPGPHAEHHMLPIVVWFVVATIAIVQVGLIFDEGSVPWAASLPAWFHDVFQVITETGRMHWYLVPTGCALVILVFGDWRGLRRTARLAWAEIGALVAYMFVSVGVAAIVTNILKIVIGRGRPVGFEDNGWLSFDTFTIDYAYASFPSGHSTTAGAAMMAAALIFPRYRLPIIVAGLLIAFSRVVVGAHFPSDTVAGLAVGIAVAYVAARLLLRRRIGFAVDTHGHIVPRTAPVTRAVRQFGTGRVLSAPFVALVGGARSRRRSERV